MIDYTIVGIAALCLLGLAQIFQLPRLFGSLSPVAGQALGFFALTLPATAALAAAESRGGSPGKRLMGARLQTHRLTSPSYPRAFLRTAAKVALPWELGHAGVWQGMAGDGGAPMLMVIGAAYGLIGLNGVQVVRSGHAWYDRLADTTVVARAQ